MGSGQTVFSPEQAPTMPRSGRSKPEDFSCWYEWQPSLPSKMIKTTWGSQRESNGHSHRIANAALRNSRLAHPILQGKLVTYIFLACGRHFACPCHCRHRCCILRNIVVAVVNVSVAVAVGGGGPSQPTASPCWAEYTFASLALSLL